MNYIYFVSVFVLSICISVLWIDFWVFCISIFGYLLVFCISISLVFYNQYVCIFCICIFWDLFQNKKKNTDTKFWTRYQKIQIQNTQKVLIQCFVSVFCFNIFLVYFFVLYFFVFWISIFEYCVSVLFFCISIFCVFLGSVFFVILYQYFLYFVSVFLFSIFHQY